MKHPARSNRLLNTLEMRQRREVLESRPYSIQLEVTTKCNLACIMCSRDKYHGKGDDLEGDILETVVRDVLPFTQDIIVSSFGEPLLFPDLPKLFNAIDEGAGLEMGFFTNLLLLDEGMAKTLVSSGVAYVNASIDGASKDTYEKIRKGGKWEALLEKIELLQRVKRQMGSQNPKVNLCVVGSTLNIHEIPEFVRMAHRFGFDSLKYQHNLYVDEEEMEYMSLVHDKSRTAEMYRIGHDLAMELRVRTNFDNPPFVGTTSDKSGIRSGSERHSSIVDRIRALLDRQVLYRSEKHWKEAGGTWANAFRLGATKAADRALHMVPKPLSSGAPASVPHPTPNDAPPRTCGNPWTHMHIKSDGLVYPCCFSGEVMGDLRKQSVEQIWNGEKYRDLRRSLTSGDYWGSCRRASCNWVEGENSTVYSCEWVALAVPEVVNGDAGGVIKARVRNSGKFRWEPQSVSGRNHVSISYRLFTKRKEIITEGLHIPIPRAVPPGGEIELELPISPIRYSGDLVLKVDMVHENVTWFGERGPNAYEGPLRVEHVEFAAWLGAGNNQEVRRALEAPVPPGGRIEFPVRITNVGTAPLGEEFGDVLACHWRDESHAVVDWEGPRMALPGRINPGDSLVLRYSLTVPAGLRTGRHWLEIDVLRGDRAWLSNLWHKPLIEWPVTVAATPGEAAAVGNRLKSGKIFVWEPVGICVPHTGNKGLWPVEKLEQPAY
ncbi:MAG: radical SAM/SPASM domain-containing protein [Candidatus Sumerlaeia bacterium]|nr:radical SAM/SPASM domain-containing protein [Candidatus Sumerlaeia bacterium]